MRGENIEAGRNVGRRARNFALRGLIPAAARHCNRPVSFTRPRIKDGGVDGLLIIGPLLFTVGTRHDRLLAERLGVIGGEQGRPGGRAGLALIYFRQVKASRPRAHHARCLRGRRVFAE